MQLPFFDSHCHFDFPEFDGDRNTVWNACQQQGMTGLMLPGVTPDQWDRAQAMCESTPEWLYSVGVHPHWTGAVGLAPGDNSQLFDNMRSQMLPHFTSPWCRAVGETGLDELIETPRDFLEALLVWHLQMAMEFNKPVILHSVRAHHYLLPILKKYRPERGGVVHAFSGSYEIAKQYWDSGFYLGIGGTISYDRAAKTRAAVQKMPLESLVLETDAPDMPLQGFQGQRNSPQKLLEVAACLAQLRTQPIEFVAHQTSENANRLFAN